MADTIGPENYAIARSSCYVKIKYRVGIVNGPVLKGAAQPETMDFVTGYGQVVPGLEARLVGRHAGETLSFTVPPQEAFGPRYPELVIEKSREDFHFPPGIQPYPGMQIPLVCSGSGSLDTAMIREVKEASIVIDCNHPLAGAPLRYDLEIVEARPARETDVCGQWEEKDAGSLCACSPHEFVVGQGPDSDGRAD